MTQTTKCRRHDWEYGIETDNFYHSYRFKECKKCGKKEGGKDDN